MELSHHRLFTFLRSSDFFIFHSFSRQSNGNNFDAFHAGDIPKINAIIKQKIILKTTEFIDTRIVGSKVIRWIVNSFLNSFFKGIYSIPHRC